MIKNIFEGLKENLTIINSLEKKYIFKKIVFILIKDLFFYFFFYLFSILSSLVFFILMMFLSEQEQKIESNKEKSNKEKSNKEKSNKEKSNLANSNLVNSNLNSLICKPDVYYDRISLEVYEIGTLLYQNICEYENIESENIESDDDKSKNIESDDDKSAEVDSPISSPKKNKEIYNKIISKVPNFLKNEKIVNFIKKIASDFFREFKKFIEEKPKESMIFFNYIDKQKKRLTQILIFSFISSFFVGVIKIFKRLFVFYFISNFIEFFFNDKILREKLKLTKKLKSYNFLFRIFIHSRIIFLFFLFFQMICMVFSFKKVPNFIKNMDISFRKDYKSFNFLLSLFFLLCVIFWILQHIAFFKGLYFIFIKKIERQEDEYKFGPLKFDKEKNKNLNMFRKFFIPKNKYMI